jgi:hypothetical protein
MTDARRNALVSSGEFSPGFNGFQGPIQTSPVGRNLASPTPAPVAAPQQPVPAPHGESKFKQTILATELESFVFMASLSLIRKL